MLGKGLRILVEYFDCCFVAFFSMRGNLQNSIEKLLGRFSVYSIPDGFDSEVVFDEYLLRQKKPVVSKWVGDSSYVLTYTDLYHFILTAWPR